MSKINRILLWAGAILVAIVLFRLLGLAFAVIFRTLWFVLRYVGLPVLLFAFAYGVLRNMFRKPPTNGPAKP